MQRAYAQARGDLPMRREAAGTQKRAIGEQRDGLHPGRFSAGQGRVRFGRMIDARHRWNGGGILKRTMIFAITHLMRQELLQRHGGRRGVAACAWAAASGQPLIALVPNNKVSKKEETAKGNPCSSTRQTRL